MQPKILFLYGFDETSHAFEIDSTLALVHAATAALVGRGWNVLPLQITKDLVEPLKPYHPKEWLVFNLCEGSPHQAFYYAKATAALHELGYVFTGSDSLCLHQTQYKAQTKALLNAAHVPTPKSIVAASAEEITPSTLNFFPAIVKPANEHCSYGITRDCVVLDVDAARKQASALITEFHGSVLIEEFLDSAEFNVSVWGLNHDAQVLGISMMTYDAFDDIHDRLCTFDAKWTPSSQAYQKIPAVCPAPISPDLKNSIERVAIAAYAATGCRDYGRVDLRVKNGVPMALDINANCGIGLEDGFINAAAKAGYDYGATLERIIHFALLRSGRWQLPAGGVDWSVPEVVA